MMQVCSVNEIGILLFHLLAQLLFLVFNLSHQLRSTYQYKPFDS
jgi:hypothetical protein